jgi:glycosyltransferase involved in cell wall biosynthesis
MSEEVSTIVILKLKRYFKTWLAKAVPVGWFEQSMRGGDCRVFSSDPLVIYVKDWVIRHKPLALLPVLKQFKHNAVYLLVSLSWSHENSLRIKNLTLWHARYLRRYPRHRLIFMTNTETERLMFADAGLETAWVSSNAFVSPAIFKPLPESKKRFDAVYDAQINPFKRHNLATGIKGLALITARAPSYHNKSYTRSVMDILPQAYFFNNPLSDDYNWMGLPEINAAVNQCRVGLCLSAEEGAMYASIQYLLAGLPVVSTQSRGGRDEFFSPDYVSIVADNAQAVAAGVSEMRGCPVKADEIRLRTLDKIEQHKTRLFELLDSICSNEDWRSDMRRRWDSWAYLPIPFVTPSAIRKRIENAAVRASALQK